MTREELNELTLEETGTKLQESFEEFEAKVKTVETTDELIQMEDELMARMKENDEVLKNTKYILPEQVVLDGETFGKSKVFEKIVYFLNKMDVEFSYTWGLYEMVKMWKNTAMTEIDYYKFDSTLRTLGQMKYHGFSEWRDITIVNQYLIQLKESYNKDTTFMMYLSKMHNSILERMDELNKPETEEHTCECDECEQTCKHCACGKK